MKPFIPKEDQEIPDSFGLTIHFHSGAKEEHQVTTYKFIQELRLFEFATQDDLWTMIPMESIKKIEGDRAFSKFVELAAKKQMQEKQKEVANGLI